MIRRLAFSALVLVGVILAARPSAIARSSPVAPLYPPTPRSAAAETYFGTKVPNPYRWLENTNSQETEHWVAEQSALTATVLSRIRERKVFRSTVMSLMTTPRDGVPNVGASATAWARIRQGERASVVMVRQGREVRVLLNPNTRWPDGSTVVTDWQLSPDGKYLAYGTEKSGNGWVHWGFLDVATGHDLKGELIGVPDWAGTSWAINSDGFYYGGYGTEQPRASGTPIGLGFRAMYHRIGASQASDVVVYERRDQPTWLPYANESLDGKYLIAGAVGGAETGNLVAIRPLRDPGAAFEVIRPKSDATYTYIDNVGTTMYFLTEKDAPHGKVVSIDIRDPKDEHDIISQNAMTLDSVVVAGNRFVAHYLKDAGSRLVVFERSGKFVRNVNLPGIGTAFFVGDRNRNTGYYYFTSITTRFVSFNYDIRTGETHLYDRVGQPFHSDQYTTQELFATSTGGARVPVFVAYRKGTKLNNKNATMITGYGGFGDSYSPEWETLGAAWIERGGVFAVACVRGGGEYGETWHRAGMLANKQHAFDDFAASARLLIAQGFTSSETLSAYGYSGGGLLVGVTEVQHPGLFGAVVEAAGPVDVLRGEKYGSEATWTNEVGSPTAAADQFAYLYAYAPLVHITQGTSYPATLVMTSQNDARVSPAHSYKFVATMQWAQGSSAPVLLYVAQNSGHVGNAVSSEADRISDAEAFLWARLIPSQGARLPRSDEVRRRSNMSIGVKDSLR
jgi:prolyl oligopeptidase